MKILLVEDDEIKGGEVIAFLGKEYPDSRIEWERSFSGGLRTLVRSNDIDLLVLDMSLPNHDSTEMDHSGAETFAGRDLLAQMKFRKIGVPTVVVTMFDTFGKGSAKVSVQELGERLSSQFSPNFVGLVYYSLAQEGWRASLRRFIEQVRGRV